jgi:hypothetical protein
MGAELVAVAAGAAVAASGWVDAGAGAEVAVAAGPQAVTSKLVRATHTIKYKKFDFIGAPLVVSFWLIIKFFSTDKRLFTMNIL